MSARNLNKFPFQQSLDFREKPLQKTQAFLKEAKVCLTLLRDLVIEIKDVTVVVALIVLFVWGFLQILQHPH